MGGITVQTHCVVLPSMYRDSVALMQLSQLLAQLPEVHRVAVMIGTPQNKALLQDAGLLTAAGAQAGANDLLIGLQATTPAAVERVVQEVRQRLAEPHGSGAVRGAMAPRTLETALRRLPTANLACISVPGQYAAYEARKALQHGLHVFLFSDHVGLEAEATLKQFAAQQGLLVMGPDCGTAVLHGVPLGFANQTGRGPVGLISASGTGLQQVICLLARQGIGISQAIGVGGRDGHGRIGGRSMRAALQALAQDSETRVIVLLSKPSHATVAARLVEEASQSGKPCVLALLGNSPGMTTAGRTIYYATTLEAAAAIAGALVRGEPVALEDDVPPHLVSSLQAARAILQPEQQGVRGLYCGGTLAYEALWLLREALGGVASNLDGTWPASGDLAHAVLDLGAEEYTSGRPHPMLDPTVRRQQLLDIARQPTVAVALCDVILGWGAHADPATALAAAWGEAQALAGAEGRRLVGVATVCGTPGDPQGYARQCQVLQAHGWLLADSNAQAVRLASAIVRPLRVDTPSPPVTAPRQAMPVVPLPMEPVPEVPTHLPALFATGPQVINIGLELFATQLLACGVPVVHVDWHPPAGGDAHLFGVLERLQ